jgi:hypothetical protein
MKRFQRGHDVEDLLSAIEDTGAVIVTEFFPDSALIQLRDAIKDRAESAKSGAEDGINFWEKFHGAQTKRFTGIGLTSEVFFNLLDDDYWAGRSGSGIAQRWR